MEIWITISMALYALSSAVVIATIGKERKAITPGTALATVSIHALFIVTGLWVLWGAR